MHFSAFGVTSSVKEGMEAVRKHARGEKHKKNFIKYKHGDTDKGLEQLDIQNALNTTIKKILTPIKLLKTGSCLKVKFSSLILLMPMGYRPSVSLALESWSIEYFQILK